jgi:hypothetical protein
MPFPDPSKHIFSAYHQPLLQWNYHQCLNVCCCNQKTNMHLLLQRPYSEYYWIHSWLHLN